MFIKVSSIFKEEKYQSRWVRIKSELYIAVFAVHHLHHTTASQEISKPLEISA